MLVPQSLLKTALAEDVATLEGCCSVAAAFFQRIQADRAAPGAITTWAGRRAWTLVATAELTHVCTFILATR